MVRNVQSMLTFLDNERELTEAPIFGELSQINPLVGSLSTALIIVAVRVVAHLFYLLRKWTQDTPFEEMVTTIENELMVVGFTAFFFKVLVFTTDFLSNEWLQSLEFADILVPIFAFSYCATGLLLIAMSIKQCDLWGKAYHKKVVELLDVYFDSSKTWWFSFTLAPFNSIISELEFRIYHNIFCEMYKIQKEGLAFDQYVERIFEKFVLHIIEIRSVDWFILFCLVMFNLIRASARRNSTFDNNCDEHDYECQDTSDTILFLISGSALFVLSIFIAFSSRMLERNVMKQRGMDSIDSYPVYLQYMEDVRDEAIEKMRLNENDLKRAVSFAKANTNEASMDEYFKESVTLWRFFHRTQDCFTKIISHLSNISCSRSKQKVNKAFIAAAPAYSNNLPRGFGNLFGMSSRLGRFSMSETGSNRSYSSSIVRAVSKKLFKFKKYDVSDDDIDYDTIHSNKESQNIKTQTVRKTNNRFQPKLPTTLSLHSIESDTVRQSIRNTTGRLKLSTRNNLERSRSFRKESVRHNQMHLDQALSASFSIHQHDLVDDTEIENDVNFDTQEQHELLLALELLKQEQHDLEMKANEQEFESTPSTSNTQGSESPKNQNEFIFPNDIIETTYSQDKNIDQDHPDNAYEIAVRSAAPSNDSADYADCDNVSIINSDVVNSFNPFDRSSSSDIGMSGVALSTMEDFPQIDSLNRSKPHDQSQLKYDLLLKNEDQYVTPFDEGGKYHSQCEKNSRSELRTENRLELNIHHNVTESSHQSNEPELGSVLGSLDQPLSHYNAVRLKPIQLVTSPESMKNEKIIIEGLASVDIVTTKPTYHGSNDSELEIKIRNKHYELHHQPSESDLQLSIVKSKILTIEKQLSSVMRSLSKSASQECNQVPFNYSKMLQYSTDKSRSNGLESKEDIASMLLMRPTLNDYMSIQPEQEDTNMLDQLFPPVRVKSESKSDVEVPQIENTVDDVTAAARLMKRRARGGRASISMPMAQLSNSNLLAPQIKRQISFTRRRPSIQTIERKLSDGALVVAKGYDISELFWFHRPYLYFETVKLFMLIIALYNALWFTNFVANLASLQLKLLAFIPGVLCTINYVYIVKVAALMKALYKVDNDAMEEILEQTEGSRQLGDTIRQRLLDRLRLMGEPQAELYSLFQQIDESGDNILSRGQFTIFMNSMDIHFSRKKWKQIFREIDRNNDDQISFEEFFLFLFPDHNIGLALEKRRFKMIGARVRAKAKHHEKTAKKKKKFKKTEDFKDIYSKNIEKEVNRTSLRESGG